MKIRNVRPKTMTICFPIGSKSQNQISKRIPVDAFQEVEISDEDGEKLIALDRQLGVPEDVRTKQDPGSWTWAREGENFDKPAAILEASVGSAAVSEGQALASEEYVAVPAEESLEASDETVEITAEESEKRGKKKKR